MREMEAAMSIPPPSTGAKNSSPLDPAFACRVLRDHASTHRRYSHPLKAQREEARRTHLGHLSRV